MIAEQIAEAKRAKRKLFLQSLIVISLLVVASIAILQWADAFNRDRQDITENVEQPDSQPIPPNVTEQPPADVQSDSQAARQAYLDAFRLYENTLKPQLDNIGLMQWQPDLAQQLTEQENQANQKFAAGDYGQAKTTLDKLITQAESTIDDSQQAFKAAMQTAQNAFDNNDFPTADAAIKQAQMLNKGSEPAQALADRIEQLPEIAALAEKIRVAKAENAMQQELKYINDLLKLAPERTELQQRAQTLQQGLNDQRFNAAIKQAHAAINSGQITTAKSAIRSAETIYPNRPEINDASNALAAVQKKQRLTRYQNQADAAKTRDDWPAVKSNLEQMTSEKPADKAVKTALSEASTIVSLQSTIADLLKTPYRLTGNALQQQARSAINNANDYAALSPSLASQRRELDTVLTAVNQPVSVEIRSDNQTHIEVRGVGIVGVTQSKVIQLKPGQYTFEGKRTGYKSKLKEVQVPYQQSQIQVSIICDEPV